MDDDALGNLLRHHADQLTEGLIETSVAYEAVSTRVRARRTRWMSVTAGLAAAAAVAGVLAVASATGEQATIRSPAASPPAIPTMVTSTVPATVSPSTVAPTPAPASTTTGSTTTSAVATATYEGAGGSITVHLSGGMVALADDPSPSPGFTTRIDDNGPDRVRVRFESDDERTEIRVEVEDGRLVPTIDEN